MKQFLMALALLALLRPAPAANDDPPFSSDYIHEICRHLYRWEMDETSVIRAGADDHLHVWVRKLEVKLDDQDASRYRELYFPQLQLAATLKKANYAIPELGQRVQNRDYMVQMVERVEKAPTNDAAYTQLEFKRKELEDYLFRTRAQREYPDRALQERLRAALRNAKSPTDTPLAAGPQTIYISPISPVSNDLWVFWETRGWLIKYSSDSDIHNPAYWEIEKVGVHVYDLAKDVVVSLDEVEGSHAYITRDWAARAVFNCIVFGQRLVITPAADTRAPMTVEEKPHQK